MVKQKILFRADGNSKIGLGHVSRCLALAEVLSIDYHVIFAIQNPDQNLLVGIKRIARETIALNHADSTEPGFQRELDGYLTGEEIVVLDGYHFNTNYEEHIKKLTRAVVSIDDIPSRHFVSDIIFNFCGSLSSKDYSKAYYTQLFLGLDYIFLRSPFLRLPSENKKYNSKLFLNMGGVDSSNSTQIILNDLLNMNYSGEIEVVVGNSYPYFDLLDRTCKETNRITLSRGLSAEAMYDAMNRCSLAITAPSTVALEFLSTGGLIFLYQTADNQALQKKYLIDSKLAFDYCDFESVAINNPQASFQISADLQKKALDRSSNKRIQRIFASLTLSLQLSLRKATSGDMNQAYEWANDPEARKYSYSENKIARNEHVQWFERKLSDPNCYYFVAEIGESPVGQVRFDLLKDENVFQISYSLDLDWRGKGLGYYLLVKGVKELNLLTTARGIIGYVREINIPSIKAFQKAGFKMLPAEKYPDSFKFELILNSL